MKTIALIALKVIAELCVIIAGVILANIVMFKLAEWFGNKKSSEAKVDEEEVKKPVTFEAEGTVWKVLEQFGENMIRAVNYKGEERDFPISVTGLA